VLSSSSGPNEVFLRRAGKGGYITLHLKELFKNSENEYF
jgi:hypothetical protein